LPEYKAKHGRGQNDMAGGDTLAALLPARAGPATHIDNPAWQRSQAM